MYQDIFGFVLALLVAGNVVLAWTIFGLKRQTREKALSLATIVSDLRARNAKANEKIEKHSDRLRALEDQSPVELGARVVELAEAVERLRKTHQRFAGRISQELFEPDNAPPTLDRDSLRREHASAIMPTGVRK